MLRDGLQGHASDGDACKPIAGGLHGWLHNMTAKSKSGHWLKGHGPSRSLTPQELGSLCGVALFQLFLCCFFQLRWQWQASGIGAAAAAAPAGDSQSSSEPWKGASGGGGGDEPPKEDWKSS